MPCYLFTFHAYGTWLPDQEEGYVRRGRGKLPQDVAAAIGYRRLMTRDAVEFSESQQQVLIDEVQVAAQHQNLRPHFVATEPTHIHILVSWQQDQRKSEKLKWGVRQSLSRRLGRECGTRQWLSEGGSRRRVADQSHYDYLVGTYLHEHGGWKWSEDKGLYR